MGAKLQAYNVKTKQKEDMHNVVIEKTANGRLFAKGTNKKGDAKLCVTISEANAKAAVKAGEAKKKGW